MSDKYEKVRLGDICEIKYGKDHKKLKEGFNPVYGTGGVMRYVNEFLYDGESVLIPRKGSLDNIYYVNCKFWTVDTLFWTKVNRNIILPKFLYYYLKTMNFSNMNVGSAVPSLTTKLLNELEINLPPLKTQEKIANILSSLDDKIENNKKIAEKLEEIAQTLFNRWFVEFNFPNENGKPYKDNGGEMVESELGMIPKGWEVGKLGDVISIIDNRGKTPPLSPKKTKYPIIDVKVLSGISRVIEHKKSTKYVDEETYNNWFRSGHPNYNDILISTVGSLAEMKLFNGKGCIAQNVVAFKCKSISSLYLYQYLSNIKNDLMAYNIGTVQPSIKVTHIIKHKIIIPDLKTLNKIHIILDGISTNVLNLADEIVNLEQLCNTLLPKLMSGEIEI